MILAPLATALMLVVGVVAWRRREAPGGWALVSFSVVEAGWLTCDALSVLAPTPETSVRLAQATFVWSPLLGVAWLAFVLSYTDRFSRGARGAVAALAAWCLVFGAMALTNRSHRLVWASWQTIRDGAFLGVTYTLGPLAWVQTGLMWTAILASLGVIVWVYGRGSARDRALSWWLVVGALVPMTVNVTHLLVPGPVVKDFTPIAMAISSGAFALGLVRYQFLDLRPVARAALVDNLGEGMLVLDTDGRVVDVNPALRAVLGASEAVIGRPLSETAPALASAIDTAPDDTLRLGERYVDLRVSSLTDRTGAPAGRLVLLHDVTRRREEQAALHRANLNLYDANTELQARNDELDAFAHTVAHDLKNSIQGVLGWAEVLRDDGPDLAADDHREVAGAAVAGAQKMGSIVHELLLLAGVRQAAVDPQRLEMGDVVAAAVARVRQTHPAVVARLGVPDRWPAAMGHAPWVEEVWVNYLSNAAKYGGPTVALGAEATDAGEARFWVHDDGPGLAPEAQERLFVPFSRVGTRDVEGHGLGLSIVRRIVERLGGTCGVESAPGRGTRFWFALPSAPEADPTERARRADVLSAAV